MSDEDEPDARLTPDEQRLLGLLHALAPSARREEAPPGLAPRVVSRARWQGALRGVLVASGGLASAVVGGVGSLLGIGRGSRRERTGPS